jgi:hypothetical protein
MENLNPTTKCRGSSRTAHDDGLRFRIAGPIPGPGERQCGRAWAHGFDYPWIPAFAGMTVGRGGSYLILGLRLDSV